MAEMVFLWTDILIFVLLAIVAAFVLVARKRAHLRRPWQTVFKSKVGISTFIVLMFYVTIGLLDSVHYRPVVSEQSKDNAELLSVLDLVLSDLRLNQEKTYSAPLATHLYARESIEQDDGSTVRDFPRLEFGGAHLTNPQQQRTVDILLKAGQGMFAGVVVWTMLALLILIISWPSSVSITDHVARFFHNTSDIPWRTALITLLLLCLLAGAISNLSFYYHVLGTDKVGEDVLYQALKSVRTGLVIGTLTTLVMLPAAILLGIMAGYFKGWVDDVIQ